MRANFVVLTTRSIVQIPGVASEEREQLFKSLIRYLNIRPVFLDRMLQEETTIQIDDFPKQLFCCLTTFTFRLGKRFKEEEIKKFTIVTIWTTFAALC